MKKIKNSIIAILWIIAALVIVLFFNALSIYNNPDSFAKKQGKAIGIALGSIDAPKKWQEGFEEGKKAAELGIDLIGTTMAGYTPYTKGRNLPDVELVHRYATELDKPVIAEGGIWCPEDLKNVYKAGAFSAVCGTAITRPMDITRRFVKSLED